MISQLLAHKLLRLALPQLATWLGVPALATLPVRVRVDAQAQTASAGFGAGGAQAQITLPETFCEVAVEHDNNVALGLLAHEIAHLPQLQETLELLAAAEQEHPLLPDVFNVTEDMRIEQFLGREPVNGWLTRTRELCAADLDATAPQDWDFQECLFWLRFGDPGRSWLRGLPAQLEHVYYTPGTHAIRDAAEKRVNFFHDARYALSSNLDAGVRGAFLAARELLRLAKLHGMPLPEPENWQWPQGAPTGAAGPGVALPALQAVLNEQRTRPPTRQTGPDEIRWDVPDQAALAAGQQLARQLGNWWTPQLRGQALAGIGKYNPRLEGYALPPFTLPTTPKPAPPPRLAVFLDISGSMWSYAATPAEPDRLYLARVALVAIGTAVLQAGGELRCWAFSDNAVYLGNRLTQLVSVRGGNTSLGWLDTALKQLPVAGDWDYLWLTDADLGHIPTTWTPQRAQRASVLYINQHTDAAQEVFARQLGQRVFHIQELRNLYHLTALAARRVFKTAARA